MDEKKVQDLFMKNYDCSQIVAAHFAKEAGVTSKMANQAAACFGGGMMCGEMCGAVTGGLIVLGLKYGHYREEQSDEKVRCIVKGTQFRERFLQKYPSLRCKELMEIDISKPGGMEAMAKSGKMMNFCPRVVVDAIKIIEELLAETK